MKSLTLKHEIQKIVRDWFPVESFGYNKAIVSIEALVEKTLPSEEELLEVVSHAMYEENDGNWGQQDTDALRPAVRALHNYLGDKSMITSSPTPWAYHQVCQADHRKRRALESLKQEIYRAKTDDYTLRLLDIIKQGLHE